MNDAVQRAVDEIRTAFAEHTVDAKDDGDGGAWVLIENVDLGEQYEPRSTWVGFRITFQYPNADVYPHFVRSDLLRKDRRPMGDGITGGHSYMGRPALQLSRRSRRLNPATDTARLKLIKVLDWLTTHP